MSVYKENNMSDEIVMPSGLRKKWLAALRSGEYKQGQGCLYRPDDKSFCCLGVLNHIALKGNVEVVANDFDSDDYLQKGDFLEVPSREFYTAFKIDMPGHKQNSLINMNDGSRCSFVEIADYIEEHSRGR
jgi:hypothetical protein